MTMDISQKAEVIKAHARGAADTGSPEVQVALLTARLIYLTPPLEAHVMDLPALRCLLHLDNQRTRLYLNMHGNATQR